MYKNKFAALKQKLEAKRNKAINENKERMEQYYALLCLELKRSNKEDCSRNSDKCRQKRVSYMANKLRQ